MAKMLTNKIIQRLWRETNRLQRKSYYLTRAAKYLQVSRSHKSNRETIIIYQMGKVGSSTIKHSLSELDLDINLYHVHSLTHKHIDRLKATYRHASRVRGDVVVHDHLVKSMYLRKLMDRNVEHRWKVITLIRDPIARNISTFFQSLDITFPEWVKEHNNGQEYLLDHIDEMITLFLKEAKHEMPLNWFDAYLKPAFGIDVYDKNFPVSKGYEIYTNNKVELLLMRLEDLDSCAGAAFKKFLGIEDFVLKKANISSEKTYSEAYARFKKSIKLPESYIDEMYSSRFVRHFYAQSEIDQFRAEWSG